MLHAASQDLPCLAEIGLRPSAVFDTELAGRLAGHERVGLGPLVAEVLGLALEKGHSAADWSTRPLPEPWLRYAALDVEVLVELRDALEAELREQGKLEWALEEFEAVRTAPPPPPRVDPWRRTSGLHKVRNRRALAVVRALWEARDAMARRRDISPGRVLPDAAIVEAALALPDRPSPRSRSLPAFSGRGTRRGIDTWWAAVEAALAARRRRPAAVVGAVRRPAARPGVERAQQARRRAARAARAAVAAIADEHGLPTENLLAPTPSAGCAGPRPTSLGRRRARRGPARPRRRSWQVALTAAPIAEASRCRRAPGATRPTAIRCYRRVISTGPLRPLSSHRGESVAVSRAVARGRLRRRRPHPVRHAPPTGLYAHDPRRRPRRRRDPRAAPPQPDAAARAHRRGRRSPPPPRPATRA